MKIQFLTINQTVIWDVAFLKKSKVTVTGTHLIPKTQIQLTFYLWIWQRVMRVIGSFASLQRGLKECTLDEANLL